MIDDPRMAKLLLLLWSARTPNPECDRRSTGHIRDEVLLTVCDADQFIEFGQRNHCYHGGAGNQKLVLEHGCISRHLAGLAGNRSATSFAKR